MARRSRFDTPGDRALVVVDYVILGVMAIIMLYPFWEQLILSVSPRAEALGTGLHLFTLKPTLQAYERVMRSAEIVRAFGNSAFRVVVGTLVAVIFTSLTAYPLSKRYFPMNKVFTAIVLLTLMFDGGLIPTYLLMKKLGLLDTRWVLILPHAVAAWNLIIIRNFLKSLPESLEESARMDGASDWLVWRRIVLPLSKPVMATIALWVAVFHWNAYFDALIYIPSRSKIVLQVILRRILLEDRIDFALNTLEDAYGQNRPTGEVMKAAIVMVSTLPIVLIYPFLQRYFVKGIMLGSVKG